MFSTGWRESANFQRLKKWCYLYNRQHQSGKLYIYLRFFNYTNQIVLEYCRPHEQC